MNLIHSKHFDNENQIERFHKFLDEIGLLDKIGDNIQKVYIKPNLMGFFHVDKPTFTDPILVNSLCDYLAEKGKTVIIIESDNMMSMVYPNCIVEKVAERVGLTHEIVNLSKGGIKKFRFKNRIMKMPDLLDRDGEEFFLIDFPKFKVHSHFSMTLNMKNMYGCLPVVNKFVEYHRKWDLNNAIAAIHHFVQPDYCIIDGIKADSAIEWYGSTEHYDLGYIIAGENPLIIDYAIYNLLKLDGSKIKFNKECEWIYANNGIHYTFKGDILDDLKNPNFLLDFKTTSNTERIFWTKVIDKVPFTQEFMMREMNKRLKKQLHDEYIFGETIFD